MKKFFKILKIILCIVLAVLISGIVLTKCSCNKREDIAVAYADEAAVIPRSFGKTINFKGNIANYPYYNFSGQSSAQPDDYSTIGNLVLNNLPSILITIECNNILYENISIRLQYYDEAGYVGQKTLTAFDNQIGYVTFENQYKYCRLIVVYKNASQNYPSEYEFNTNFYFYAGEYGPGFGQGFAAGIQQANQTVNKDSASYEQGYNDGYLTALNSTRFISAGTYHLDEYLLSTLLNLGESRYYDFNFISNELQFKGIYLQQGNTLDSKTMYYDRDVLGDGEEIKVMYTLPNNENLFWEDNAYQTIIVKTEQEVTKQFYQWFMQNVKFTDDYDKGYTNGYNTGLDVGTSQGYNNGYNNGYTSGYDYGYDYGLNLGNQEGYAKAVAEGVSQLGLFNGALAFIRVFFQLITQFLETKIAGDITLGLLVIGLPAAFMIINLAIGLVKKLLGARGASEGDDG